MSLRPPAPPEDFAALVQWHADEVELLYASLGETTDYLGYADDIHTQLEGSDDPALLPGDPALWRAVADELRRREAGVVTPDNEPRFDLIAE